MTADGEKNQTKTNYEQLMKQMTGLKYYTLVMLNSTGNRQLREIEVAKRFFVDLININNNTNEISDTLIQKRLLELFQNNSSQSSLLAQRCLLCFISWQSEQVCLFLEKQFGNFHGFTCGDLLPYVLDDDGNLQPSNTYQCFSRQILDTFDSEKSSLTTWTSRKVKQHKELNKYLLDCGLYLISDWAILNDTKPQQLENILGEFHYLTKLEIEQAQKLLSAYHKVYRAERFSQRANNKSRGRCNLPTIPQLQEITEVLKTKEIYMSTKIVMQNLQNLADLLRQYRIHVRGASFPTESLDEELNEFALIEQISAPKSENIISEEDETKDFLKNYRLHMINCLDNGIKTVIQLRLKKLQKKDPEKANKFAIALHLFHCQRLSMSKIAQQLGLRAQDAVARLLKLKEFRADVRREILVKLKEQVIELAQKYSTPTSITSLEAQITEALDEQITNIISQAEVEATTMQSNVAMSYFSQRLCRQLDNTN
jgi:macrodomain Ter protein organizer (MatP/YcbG family)